MSRKALRYKSTSDMPASMRALLESKASMHTTAPAKANKYNNQVTRVDGIRFDSKREAKFYEQLKARKAGGEIAYFLRQVPIHLPGGTKLVVDFLVVYSDPMRPVEFVDAKGRETPAFKIKRREVQHHYPFTITLV